MLHCCEASPVYAINPLGSEPLFLNLLGKKRHDGCAIFVWKRVAHVEMK